ncbi:16S rRNA (guanine1516-N2)-methyltransferase [Idiomarina fontislapidosi]|uniref:Ribosomal RNA small subunit methyltransferase J n=1 Tax=Idiomarina fontislapidosi TaxID=263723 RepID=A0A432XSR8_9GAMM|nr:class I SAM-dependent methyltransferase [Idiomarina fontislapidosi]PYE31337.1 16S rRNA (guanine1516-N2)-methyltransferase [Idiomarina fontislapidosi]RUO51703.1 16S rRNA methyltransferase [Idiomarina fontislapidosi]
MSADFQLKQTNNGLELVWLTGPKAIKPLSLDFRVGKAGYRAVHSSLKSESLIKALGITGKRKPRVLDATAGLARDALMVAAFGSSVDLIERHPLVRALLRDAINRGRAGTDKIADCCERMQLLDFQHVNQVPAQQYDVVYLDPMYPKSGKQRAQVKKDMQMFQQLVGADEDADELLDPALQAAKYRVVVKRPDHADFLGQREPNTQIISKKHRFDVYIKQGFEQL